MVIRQRRFGGAAEGGGGIFIFVLNYFVMDSDWGQRMDRYTLNVQPQHVMFISECSPVQRKSLARSLILPSFNMMELGMRSNLSKYSQTTVTDLREHAKLLINKLSNLSVCCLQVVRTDYNRTMTHD